MKQRKHICVSVLMLALALLTSCEKDTLPTNFAPGLMTGDATDIYRKGATLNGSIQKSSGTTVSEYGVMYSISPSLADAVMIKYDGETDGDFSIELSDLEPGRQYYYSTYASSGYSIAKAADIKQFTTENQTVVIFDNEKTVVSNVTETSFDVTAAIKDDGGSGEIQELAFRYAEVSAAGAEWPETYEVKSVKSLSDFRASIIDRVPGKIYAVRPYAANGKGTSMGDMVYVTMKTTEVPAISSIDSLFAESDVLRVRANILSEGTSPVTERGFVYSSEVTLPEYGHSLKVTAPGSGETFEAELTGLKPGEIYYIRAYAINAAGIGYSTPRMFVVENYDIAIPVLSPAYVYDITVSTATAESRLADNGKGEITSLGFVVSSSNNNPTVYNCDMVLTADDYDTNTGTYRTFISGLNGNTTYYIRPYASNSAGTGYGETAVFKTLNSEKSDIKKDEYGDDTEW